MSLRTARILSAEFHLRGLLALFAMIALAALVALAGEHAGLVAAVGGPLAFGPLVLGSIFPPQFYSNKPRMISLGIQAFAFGGPDLRWRLEKYGYLDQLWINLTGTVTIGVANLVGVDRFPWNIFSAVKLSPPGRMKFSGDTGSHSFHILDLLQRGFGPFSGTALRVDTDGLDANTGTLTQLDTFPVAVGGPTPVLMWWNINMRRSATDPRGRIPLHNDKDVMLYLTPNTLANLVTVPANVTATALNVEVFQITYDEIPVSDQIAAFDTKWALITEEFATPVAGTGNQVIVIPTGDDRIYTHIIHALRLATNGLATSGFIDQVQFKVDQSYLVDPNTPAYAYYYEQKRSLGLVLPDGHLAYDFDSLADSDGSPVYVTDPQTQKPVMDPARQPSLGRWLATKGSKQIRSQLHIPSGQALGTNPTIWTTIRYFLPVGG